MGGARDALDLFARAPARFPGAIREIPPWSARRIVSLTGIAAKFALLLESTLGWTTPVVIASWTRPVVVAARACPVVGAARASAVVSAARAALEPASLLAPRPFLAHRSFRAHRPFLAYRSLLSNRPFRRWRDGQRRRHGPLCLAPLPIKKCKCRRRHLNGVEAVE